MQAEREKEYAVTTTEHELKWLLTEAEYGKLSVFLETLPSLKEHQTNYYFDTHSGKLRDQNITMRIREKCGKLQGTIKRHLEVKHCSVEENFRVDAIPGVMMFEGDLVYLMGSLETRRTIFFLSDSVRIMMDRNAYLHCVDYELELECPKEFMECAEGIMFFLQRMVRAEGRKTSLSKSERFFRKKEEKDFITLTGSVRDRI